ncbi:hypothetical protein KP509_06G000800 [Ceratopteris richardii]|uniref:Serine/threonine-protein phosphatase 4 regulatory subunit 3-like central domain-containing protein n=5 Tax=Ceratopteris richardii TaxID=49495 RepID=A0A8T2UKW1_CERRI|nr:hypothetical protein KP509_06G000800 [Ceratopteris richardii]KAH7434116.1 hypothetical protein KP509_06G000800 [Ceratopteris richardii]
MEFQRYLQRAKVYRLNDEGRWDDKGTGHVSVEYLERSEAAGLVVIDEDDNTTLLVHRISAEDIYRRAEERIIAWRDPEVATNLALSFEETMCCAFIWDQICEVRRSLHFPSGDVDPRSTSVVLEHLGTSQGHDGGGHEVMELPPLELSSLPQISKILVDSLDREQIASLIVKDSTFLSKLVDLFTMCEDVENLDGLHMLFKIAKAIVSLNDGEIFDVIFSDKYIMHIVGMLEYDPDVSTHQNHRTFLKEQVVFKEAVPIPDLNLLAKIHQTYRIGYLKDVVLPNVLDNPTVTSINSMILNNNVTVVSGLLDHPTFVNNLFTELKSSILSEEAKKDLVHFLQEFCSLSKSLQLPLRNGLFSTFVREGLFEVVTNLLQSTDENLRQSGTDILLLVLSFDASQLRKFLMQQSGYTLFGHLVTGMLTPSQGGLQAQLLEVLRMLLDCEATERTPPEKSPFLEVFYTRYMDQIIEVLTGPSTKKRSDQDRKMDAFLDKRGLVSAEILGNICELLCFCVQHHSYRIKYYVMKNQVMEKVLQLTTRREKHLVVAAVRFLRTCIGRKDEFYYRYIVKNDLFGPVIQAFLVNGNRYNLLNSAVLELFKFIYDENAKALIIYLIEKYYQNLENIQYVDIFKKLKTRYDQASEGVITRAQDSGAVGSRERGLTPWDKLFDYPESRRRKDDRAPEKEEEEYFNEDSDDEEDTASIQRTISAGKPAQAVIVNGGPLSGTFGLVDYEDEDEDMPPPVRSNGNEDVNFSAVASATISKDSVWLDREEEKIFQNVKRKPQLNTEIREKETDISKRQKTSSESSCGSEHEVRPSAGEPASLGKAELESSVPVLPAEDGLGSGSKDNSKESSTSICTKSTSESSTSSVDTVNKGVEVLGPLTNGPNLVKAHGAVGS